MKANTSFTINFSHKQVSPDFPLYFGYVKHYKGFIKKDDNGRFHITDNGGRQYSIHYDVNTVEGRHMTLPSDHILPKEFKRLIGYIKKCKDIEVKVKKEKEQKIEICTVCKLFSQGLHKGKCKDCIDLIRIRNFQIKKAKKKEMQKVVKQQEKQIVQEKPVTLTIWQKIKKLCKK